VERQDGVGVIKGGGAFDGGTYGGSFQGVPRVRDGKVVCLQHQNLKE